jgi:predicted enzyme related to lactoylglutathione lyase
VDLTSPGLSLVNGYLAGKHERMVAIGRLAWIQIDCTDPLSLAAFWSEVLGVEIGRSLEDPVQYLSLAAASPEGPLVTFQRVPEVKSVKNRLHFDVTVDDVEYATARIESLGGGRLPTEDFSEDGFSWRVMVDPEGNEFCLIFTQA